MHFTFFVFYEIILSDFFKLFYDITGQSLKVMITLKSKVCKLLKIYGIKTVLLCTYLIASSSPPQVACLLDQCSEAGKHVTIRY